MSFENPNFLFGIGCKFRHAIVEELLGLGATVHTCSRNEAELDGCLKDWSGKGFRITGSVCDVSSRVDRERLMYNVRDVFDGKLNILVHSYISPFPHCVLCIHSFGLYICLVTHQKHELDMYSCSLVSISFLKHKIAL